VARELAGHAQGRVDDDGLGGVEGVAEAGVAAEQMRFAAVSHVGPGSQQPTSAVGRP
jgi:hypothetical protein